LCRATPWRRWKPSTILANGDGSTQIILFHLPVRELVDAMDVTIPEEVREVSDGLQYRDFITVGLLVDKLTVREADGVRSKTTDLHSGPDVLVGRLQIFNNWSPYLVADRRRRGLASSTSAMKPMLVEDGR